MKKPTRDRVPSWAAYGPPMGARPKESASMWCCVSPNRVEKTGMIMRSLVVGWPGAKICLGPPPEDGKLYTVWGQIWLAEDLILRAQGRKFFQIDNGFYLPARGRKDGYYRFMYSRPDPILVTDLSLLTQRMGEGSNQLHPIFTPLRQTGNHVLIAMPGPEFGRAHGLDMRPWIATIVDRVRAATERPVRVRDRLATNSLRDDLKNCWAVVTHSSNVAVDAILVGVPVFVEPTSMATSVGNLSLDKLEDPFFPSEDLRDTWWASLMCQQFSVSEMRSGVAHFFLSAIHGLPGLPQGSGELNV